MSLPRVSGLSDEFSNDAQKDKQWQAFLRKNALDPIPLAAVISELRGFLLPVLESLSAREKFEMTWRKGEGWGSG